jgi:2-(1,2-epoxy-1,2-dihydrophenyl)acetyl-CoA isomerase
MLGDKLPAQQAADWGLIWRCVDDAELAPAVDKLAAELALAPTLGLVRTRQAIDGAWQHSLSEQLDMERDFQRELGWTSDFAEGVAAFSGKRPPHFSGR